jgi:uncharacterized protein YdaU (DUF1376 family)
MAKPPAFQFYAADFILDTAGMSTEQVGAYIRLLCFAWVNTGIPEEAAQQAQIAGLPARRFASHVWPAVARCWDSGDGRLVNPRQEKERQRQIAWREKSAKGGKANGKPKANQK